MALETPGFPGHARPSARTPFPARSPVPPALVDERKNFPPADRIVVTAVRGMTIVLRGLGLFINPVSPIHSDHACRFYGAASRALFSTLPIPALNVRPGAPIRRSFRSPTPVSIDRPDARVPRSARLR